MHTVHLMCQYSSANGCFSEGLAFNEGRAIARNPAEAAKNFGRACDLGMIYGCVSLIKLVQAEGPDTLGGTCERGDGESCYTLGSLYHAGQGVPHDDARA